MRFRFRGMNNVAAPASIDCFNAKSRQYGQCVDICNCDLDDEDNAITRDGFSLIEAGNITSAWTSRDGVTYCVYNARICTFDGTDVTVLDADVVIGSVCEFEQVNDVVVFSDNVKIGIIELDGTVTLISHPSDWVDVTDLEQWVTDHYPADHQAVASNMEVDAYKLATLAGKCLHFFNGALYLAIDNFVYATKTFNIEYMDIRYCVVGGFEGAVTTISHVADGLFVGTTRGDHFLAGTGIVVDENYKVVSEFTGRQISTIGAIEGTSALVDASLIPALQTSGMVALWVTRMGIMAGLQGGVTVNLSADKVTLPDATKGAAIVQQLNGTWQYKVCFDVAASLFTTNDTVINTAALQDTWVLNLQQLTHSRFTRYPFNSLFNRGANRYGANKLGIFRFTGDTDFAGVTSLAQKVAAFALTPSVDLGKKEKKYLQAFYVTAACDGELAVDYYVNGVLEYEDDVILFDDQAGAHTLRADPPRGLSGTFWQIKLKNVDGSIFTAYNLEPVFAVSASRTR